MSTTHRSCVSPRGKTRKKKENDELSRKSQMLFADYSHFLREIRGLTPESVAQMVRFSRRFLGYTVHKGITSMADFGPELVQAFLITQSQGYARETVLGHCWKLRRFLSFLHFRGETRLDLSLAVIQPRTYRRESCPSYFTRVEVEHVISRIDRRTSEGKRDYAVLILLATYGLRGGEVAGLRLDDIEWRAQQFHIRNRKGGGHLVHPLTPEVAHALLSYFKGSRPKTSDRHVFVFFKPPHTAHKSRTAIASIVKRCVGRAGIKGRRMGAHTFRHSCAQRLLEDNHGLKTIADYLGHRSLDTTRRYLSIDTEHLRAVALNRGEDLP